MSRLALMLALLAAPMSATAGGWRTDNVDLPESLGEILTVEFTVAASSRSGTVNFSSQSTTVDANGTTAWVSGKDESGLTYRARLSEGSIEVEVTGAPVTKVTTTLNNAQGEQLVSAALTETAERAQEPQRAVRPR